MNLDELRTLIAVGQHGSLLSASEALNMSRSTLRRRLAELETRVGVPLVEQGREGCTLTAAGALLARQGADILRSADALLARTAETGHAEGRSLRVMAPVGLPPLLIATLFAHVRAELPELEVRVQLSRDPVAEDLDEIDLAFHFGPRTPRGQWITTVLYRIRERLIASQDYLNQHGTPRSCEDLAQHTLLSWEPPGEDFHRWPTLDGLAVPVKVALASSDVHMIRQCVIAGVGIGRVPEAELPDPGLEPGYLVTLFPERFGRDCSLRALVPESRAALPRVRAALELLRSVLPTF